jgi:two-component system, LuxR family, response regulator FixJ
MTPTHTASTISLASSSGRKTTIAPGLPRTVYIVDDNIEFLQSAQWWLEGAGFEVQSFGSAKKAVETLTRSRMHAKQTNACLLLDVRMPEMSGLEMHDALLAQGVNLPVVYMTGHGDVPLAVEAMRKGAITFIEKPFADEALESALALAFLPRSTTPASGQVVAAITAPEHAKFAERMTRLTQREREVIGWVIQGKLNKVTAEILGISIKTVELHRKNAMSKLELSSVIDLTRFMLTGKVLSS